MDMMRFIELTNDDDAVRELNDDEITDIIRRVDSKFLKKMESDRYQRLLKMNNHELLKEISKMKDKKRLGDSLQYDNMDGDELLIVIREVLDKVYEDDNSLGLVIKLLRYSTPDSIRDMIEVMQHWAVVLIDNIVEHLNEIQLEWTRSENFCKNMEILSEYIE